MTSGDRLRLRAEDERDLEVLGAMAQDAIVPLADMLYLPDESRFVLVLNRFMWERAGEAIPGEASEAPAEAYCRVHGLLSIQHVRSVQVRDIDQRNRGQFLSILSVRGGLDHVRIEFAGGGTIRVEVERLMCILEDMGEPWPTRWRPGHPIEDDLGGDPPG